MFVGRDDQSLFSLSRLFAVTDTPAVVIVVVGVTERILISCDGL